MAKALNIGDRIDRVMIVAKKVRRDYTGGKFLLFQFSDREGTLKGVWWEPSKEAEDNIKANDVVRVEGEIQEYQGAPQLKVSGIEKLSEEDFDPSLFLPVSSRDLDAIYSSIMGSIEKMESRPLRLLLQTIFSNEGFRMRFLRYPAAKGWHHAYVGGLAEHVSDMLLLADAAAGVYEQVDRDLLTAGVLLHDVGKLEELTVTNHIDYSDRGRLFGHISLGVSFLDEYLRGIEDFPADLEMRLKHMILSHHGQLDHGSPVVPMTVEAMLLSYIDNMDAQVRGAIMAMDKNGGEGSWTEYIRLLDRFIYRGEGSEEDDGGEEVEEDG